MGYVKAHYRNTPNGRVWVKGHYRSSKSSGCSYIVILIIGIPIIGYYIFKALFNFIAANLEFSITFGIIILFILLMFFSIKQNKKHKIIKYRNELNILIDKKITEMDNAQETWDHIELLLKKISKLDDTIKTDIENAYAKIVSTIVEDGKIDDSELEFLTAAENAFHLKRREIESARTIGFLEVYKNVISDDFLSEDEEHILEQLRKNLSLNDSLIEYENKMIAQLSEARKIRSGNLTQINTTFNLQNDEKCFYKCNAQEIKRKKIKDNYTYLNGQFGSFYITNKQILFISDGTVSIKLGSIVNINIFHDSTLFEIIKIGRQTPYYFSFEKPYLVLEYINTLKKG